jgi:hypothetical protein
VQPALVGVPARRCRLGANRSRWLWLSERLRIPVGELVEYGSREQTRTDHLQEVARYLGWRLAEEFQWRELDEFGAPPIVHRKPTSTPDKIGS